MAEAIGAVPTIRSTAVDVDCHHNRSGLTLCRPTPLALRFYAFHPANSRGCHTNRYLVMGPTAP